MAPTAGNYFRQSTECIVNAGIERTIQDKKPENGLHPSLVRVQTKLPSAVGRARWHLVTASSTGPAQALDLVADTLVIDADRQICSVVRRGRFALERPDLAPWVRVFAGVELGGQPIAWSRSHDASTAEFGCRRRARRRKKPATS